MQQLLFTRNGKEATLSDIVAENYTRGPEALAQILTEVAQLEVGGFCFLGSAIVARIERKNEKVGRGTGKDPRLEHLQ